MQHLLRPKGHFVILYLRQIYPQGVWLLILTRTERKKDFFCRRQKRNTFLQEPMHSRLHIKTDFCLIQNTFLVALMRITYC